MNVFDLIKQIKVDKNIFYEVIRKSYSEKYISYNKKKHIGGYRKIEKPIDKDLIIIQRKLLKHLFEPAYNEYRNKSVHGFAKNRSIITNAKTHLDSGNKYIIKIDLKDFFNSITYKRLFHLFRRVWEDKNNRPIYNDGALNSICLLVTCNNHLPQGACTSPILSNMICKRMDQQLVKYCKKHSAIYTRYADDITISTNDVKYLSYFFNYDNYKENGISIEKAIISIIKNNGFVINDKKIKFLDNNKSMKVTGIVINEKLNVRRKYIKDLRATIYKFENDKKFASKKLIGKVNFLRQVRGKDDELANKYALRVNRLGVPPFPDANFRINETDALKYYLIKIETPSLSIGTGFIASGFLITSKHVLEIDGSCTDNKAQCKHGYWPTITIRYYDSFNLSEKKINVNISECLVYNEIAFAKIDKIYLLNNKSLKIIESTEDIKTDSKVITSGYQDIKDLAILKYHTAIINIGYYINANCMYLKPRTIYKGMSGAPVFDSKTYSVIGVNYTGQSKDEKNADSVNCTAAIITKGTYKKATKWEADEIGKTVDQKIINDYLRI